MYALLQCNYMYSIVQKFDRAKKGQMKYAQNAGKQNFDECESHVFTNAYFDRKKFDELITIMVTLQVNQN